MKNLRRVKALSGIGILKQKRHPYSPHGENPAGAKGQDDVSRLALHHITFSLHMEPERKHRRERKKQNQHRCSRHRQHQVGNCPALIHCTKEIQRSDAEYIENTGKGRHNLHNSRSLNRAQNLRQDLRPGRRVRCLLPPDHPMVDAVIEVKAYILGQHIVPLLKPGRCLCQRSQCKRRPRACPLQNPRI